jgi:hypothetical protein
LLWVDRPRSESTSCVGGRLESGITLESVRFLRAARFPLSLANVRLAHRRSRAAYAALYEAASLRRRRYSRVFLRLPQSCIEHQVAERFGE